MVEVLLLTFLFEKHFELVFVPTRYIVHTLIGYLSPRNNYRREADLLLCLRLEPVDRRQPTDPGCLISCKPVQEQSGAAGRQMAGLVAATPARIECLDTRHPCRMFNVR